MAALYIGAFTKSTFPHTTLHTIIIGLLVRLFTSEYELIMDIFYKINHIPNLELPIIFLFSFDYD